MTQPSTPERAMKKTSPHFYYFSLLSSIDSTTDPDFNTTDPDSNDDRPCRLSYWNSTLRITYNSLIPYYKIIRQVLRFTVHQTRDCRNVNHSRNSRQRLVLPTPDCLLLAAGTIELGFGCGVGGGTIGTAGLRFCGTSIFTYLVL